MQRLHAAHVAIVAIVVSLMACSPLAHEEGNRAHNPLELIHVNALKHELDNNIQLTLNSTVLEAGHSFQWFELSWKGVSHPSYGDWVGLIVPAGADVTQTAPAKYQTAALDPNHVRSGEGKLK